MNKKNNIDFLLLQLLLIAVFCSCNIFDFSDKEEITPVEKAEEYIRFGKYDRAKELLADAVDDSLSSDVLYFLAKATLLQGGYNIIDIISKIKLQDPEQGLKLALLEFIDQANDSNKNSWFASNIEVVAVLRLIWLEKTTGMFSKNDIAIDYTLANMMTGILKIRDPNGDYLIDYRDFELDMNYFIKQSGFLRSGVKIDGAKIKDAAGDIVVNDQGLPVILQGLTAFVGDWGALVPDVNVQYKPDDINSWLNDTLSWFTETGSILDEAAKTDDNTSFDLVELKKYNTRIATSLNSYWYDDGVDNDGDGRIDEEEINGIDDDQDGLIDEDSRYHKADTTPEKNTRYIPVWNELLSMNKDK